jgi:hypothetical protein
MALPISTRPIVTTVNVHILLFSPLNENFDFLWNSAAVDMKSKLKILVF